MSNAQILFLNGASSSGKSTVARALQDKLEEPCIHLCIDDYLGAFQKRLWANKHIMQREWHNIVKGFHAAAAAIARVGNHVIVDDVLEKNPPWQASLVELFDGLDVVFVGVHCPLKELERREALRGDRRRGMARLDFNQVHAQAIYDVKVDTSILSPEECAATILDYTKARRDPSAFERLRERLLSASTA